jgi:uncharacterized lipoprotein YddW (UPF0748 family)
MRFTVAPLVIGVAAFAHAQTVPDSLRPPEPMREFRALWVATVRNMDWPSQPGLSTEEQQRELLAILDRAAELNLNAIVLQVRPEADALYASTLEPWSRYLTGQQGQPPEPAWDPLAFAVEEAHRRGLELHAWFNPYRAAYQRTEQTAPSHISRRRPELVVPYGQYLWLDPANAEVRQRMVRVVLDVVRRYDIDGVHIDDYFYPYPETVRGGRLEFPDDRSYRAYRRGGGKLSRGDWRRRNVDVLIRDMYAAVKGQKMWVKVGISPFGIWRPGYPPTIEGGIDAYAELYADARKWLREGTLDYIAPQLYWPVRPAEQSYPVLLQWWVEQSVKNRHVWPGLALYKLPATGRSRMTPDDIAEQIELTRGTLGATGHIHFNAKILMDNIAGIADRLASLYREPALIPAMPWLDKAPPARPVASATRDSTVAEGEIEVRFAPAARDAVARWVVNWRADGEWGSRILPGGERRAILVGDRNAIDLVAVSAVDRNGNISIPAVTRPR